MFQRRCVQNITLIKNVHKLFKRKLVNNISSSYIVSSGFPDIEIPNVTLPEFIEPFHQKFEKYTAIECAITKRKYTYGELRIKSTNLSKGLRKILKLKDDDVVAIILFNIPEYPIANLGILKANLTVTTISPAYTPDEIARQIVSSGAKAIITEVDLVPTVKKAVQIFKKELPFLVVKTNKDQALPENTIDFNEFVSAKVDHPDILPCDPEKTAFLPFSSGTMGLPKGVQLSHKNLVSNLMQDHHLSFKEPATENFQEVLPTILPLYHVFGYSVLMNGVPRCGGKLVTLKKFKQELYINMLKEYNSTVLYVVPPIVLMLIGNEGLKKEYLKNVKVMLSGAAPLAASDEERFLKKFGDHIKILQGYGLSETSPVIASLFPQLMEEGVSYQGSIGRPIVNTQIKIVDPDDPKNTPLKPNTKGELLVKGPQVMKGYLNLPEETKKTITEDGWLRSGDVGYYNEDGFFFITDRFKELIKVKGNQVPPAELEAVIRSFPGVLDVGVIGVPHETSGEVPRAYVVPKNAGEFDTKKLDDFVTEKVARYKRLKGGIVVVKEIPKNASGKILRRKLKEEFLKNGI